MTRTQYLTLKEELKELVQKIRNQKAVRRTTAQAFSKFQKENHTFNDFYKRRIGDSDWLPIKEEYWKHYKQQLNAAEDVDKMRADYRIKHVVYCIARGRTLEEIEPHVREGNELDKRQLKKMLEAYEVEAA